MLTLLPMVNYLMQLREWIIILGDRHGVDPLVLGCLYLVSKLCFFSFLGWVLKNIRSKKPFMIPLLFAFLSFSVPYMYLIVMGRNISVWVYVFIAFVFMYGAFSIWKKVAAKPVPSNAGPLS